MRKIFLLTMLLVAFLTLQLSAGEISLSTIPLEDQVQLGQSDSRAACTMSKHNGSAANYWGGFGALTGAFTYFNPVVECGSPTYPFEIIDFTFTLHHYNEDIIWPAVIDIVVYAVDPTGGDSCLGPGTELCRFSLSADSSTYAFPNFGTYTLPATCCVEGPFFMGIEYTQGDPGFTPSVLFDNQEAATDTCDNWLLYGVFYEWNDVFSPSPGYPMFEVGGETASGNCVQTGACCYYSSGDECLITTVDSCSTVFQGVYMGDGTVCGGKGACVVAGGIVCNNNIDSICCENYFAGTFAGEGSSCMGQGACCLSDGSCVEMEGALCNAQGGWPSPGASCGSQPYACCLSGGGCLDDIDSLCCENVYFGTPSPYSASCLGDQNSDGVDDACQAPIGACCYGETGSEGLCMITTEDSCTTYWTNGAYQGDGTVCLGDSDGDGKDDLCVAPWRDHKMHFPQLPDSMGWDVMATDAMTLADDWQCSQSGWVKDIHFWGSWLNDIYFPIDGFILVIWPDIPADPPQIPYSYPGYPSLWTKGMFEFNETIYEPQTLEGWYNPEQGLILPDNHQSYIRYDIELDSLYWFWQEQGTIYWLSVLPIYSDPSGEAKWGWKSSVNHFNDDAVWADGGPPFEWFEMYEPPNYSQSLDLAFVITGGEPCDGTCGDANHDSDVNISDAVYIINYVFVGGGEPLPALACGDANGDGDVNVSDAVYIINYVFVGGDPPGDCAPGSPNWYNGDCCQFVPPRK